MPKLLITFILLTLTTVANADTWQYLQRNIAAYGAAITHCNAIAASRSLPSSKTLDLLAQIDASKLQKWLITQNARTKKQCAQPALSNLAYALGLLKSLDLPKPTADAVDSTKKLLYGKSVWQMRQAYYSLPTTLRKKLSAIAYFQQPFNNIAVYNAIKQQTSHSPQQTK